MADSAEDRGVFGARYALDVRVVVHIGAQRTASDAIHRGLFANVDTLADNGVLVPAAARHEGAVSPNAVRHHLLAWSFDRSGEHPYEPTVWDALAAEIAASSAHTALLSSELLAPVAADPSAAAHLQGRLRSLSDDVTVVLFVRDQLTLLNSLYCQRVKSFEVSGDFETYLAHSRDASVYDLAASFGPWFEAGVRFVAVPWPLVCSLDATHVLVEAAGIDVDPGELLTSPASRAQDIALGPIGIEATRLLGVSLRERFPDFRWGELAARRLRRRATKAALSNGWFGDEFWGWSQARADEVAAGYAESNQEFARRAWGGGWDLPAPVGRVRNVAVLDQLDPLSADQVQAFLADMARTFRRLRNRQAAA